LNKNLFSIEINGQSILTFDTSNLEMAKQLAASPQFRSHLMSHATNPRRVWDGQQPIRVREAVIEEIETWTAVFQAIGEPERRCLVWLIPVADPNARRSVH
jgi:hypothetical protein